MTRLDEIPEEDRCRTCRGHGWFQVSHDPDIDEDCAVCGGTGRAET